MLLVLLMGLTVQSLLEDVDLHNLLLNRGCRGDHQCASLYVEGFVKSVFTEIGL